MQIFIEIASGKKSGMIIPIKRLPFLIGRSEECNLRPANTGFSRRHCQIDLQDGRITLEDFSSLNGTYLNGKRVEGSNILQDGDLIIICKLRLIIHLKTDQDAVRRGLDVATRTCLTLRVIPRQDQQSIDLIREISSALQITQQVFCPFKSYPLISESLLDRNSQEYQTLGINFRHVLILDARRACEAGYFDLEVFYHYAATRVFSLLELASRSVTHEQDIIQLLRDENNLLICFLFVDLIPVDQLCRIRSLIQEEHHSLIIYQCQETSILRVDPSFNDRTIEKGLSDSHQSPGSDTVDEISPDDLPRSAVKVPKIKIPKALPNPQALKDSNPQASKDIASEILKKFFGSR